MHVVVIGKLMIVDFKQQTAKQCKNLPKYNEACVEGSDIFDIPPLEYTYLFIVNKMADMLSWYMANALDIASGEPVRDFWRRAHTKIGLGCWTEMMKGPYSVRIKCGIVI